MDKFYVTTPIYYASGKPHIGHAFTTIYADVISRYQKLQGKDVFLLTGMDEHGSKIAEKAKAEKKAPQKFVNEISKTYVETWAALDIGYDNFIRTTSEKHKKGVLEFIKKIHDSGDIYEGSYEGLYCVQCEKFYTEKELVNNLCPDHLIPPQKVQEKNYFFNLRKYLPRIKDKISSNEIKITPESRRNEILSIINQAISDFSITREKVKWGIPFPYDKNQTIYVWVEALMNYVTALDFPSDENYKKFWPPDLHIIGAEINKFHSIFWPGLLLSANLPLPKNIFVHGLFTVNGQKMSKTIGNIIDPLEMVGKFETDGTRYLLLSQFPASEHGDIKESDFKSKYNADLANGLGNLFERIFKMVVDYKIKIDNKNIEGNIRKLTKDIDSEYKNHLENYQLFEALRSVFQFVKKLDQYINEKEPWNLQKSEDKSLPLIINSLFFGANEIAHWLLSFTPTKADLVKSYMAKIKNGGIKKDEKLNLFPRIKE